MSHRQLNPTDNAELRTKIDEAKRRLSLPQLLVKLGLEKHVKTSARCPFPDHEDKRPSFSLFKGKNGYWLWKCHSRCGEGDEIAFLQKLKGLSLPEAMNFYLDMAGFPPRSASKSHEYPKSPASLNNCVTGSLSNCVSVSLCPEGQSLEAELRALAVKNACTPGCSVSKRQFKLARGLQALAKHIGRKLTPAEVKIASDEWCRLSEPLLDPEKSPEDYFISLLAQITKVQKPTGEDTITEALAAVAKLSEAELPMIPEWPDAPENVRRVVALHRELHRSSTKPDKRYFLDYRNAAKAGKGLTPSKAHDITSVLPLFGVIEFVNKGKPGLNSGEAAEFRYLLSMNENTAEEHGGLDLQPAFPSRVRGSVRDGSPRCGKIRPNSRCAGSGDYAGYMFARHIKPKKIVFHSRLLPHETCRMNRVQHLKTKKGFLVFLDRGFMTYQPQT